MRTTVIHPDTWWILESGQREELRDWMRSNHLEADDIPAQEAITCDDTTIYYTAVVRGDKGQMMFEKNEKGEPMIVCEERTTPLLTPPPTCATP